MARASRPRRSGVPLQVVIFGLTRNPRYPDAEPVPQTVLINPRIELPDDDTEDGWEAVCRCRACADSCHGSRGCGTPAFDETRLNAIDRTVTGISCARRSARGGPPERRALPHAHSRLAAVSVSSAALFRQTLPDE
mgnify:CR=1 FL=1